MRTITLLFLLVVLIADISSGIENPDDVQTGGQVLIEMETNLDGEL